MKELIELAEDFKHNAIIDKEELAKKLILEIDRKDKICILEENCNDKICIPQNDFRSSDLLDKLKRYDVRVLVECEKNPQYAYFEIEGVTNKTTEKCLADKIRQFRTANDSFFNETETTQILDTWKYSSRFLKLFATVKEKTKDYPEGQIQNCQELINHLRKKHLLDIPEEKKEERRIKVLDYLFTDKIAKGYITEDEIKEIDITPLTKNSDLLNKLIKEMIVVQVGDKPIDIYFDIATEKEFKSRLGKATEKKDGKTEKIFKKNEIANVLNFWNGISLEDRNKKIPVLRDKLESDLAILNSKSDKPGEYRFNKVFFKETDLEEELNDIFQLDDEKDKKVDKVLKAWEWTALLKPVGKILSDVLNRIGFLLFDLRLHPEEVENQEVKRLLIIDNKKYIDLALDWVEKAYDINPDNGFTRFNQLLIKDSPHRQGSGKGQEIEDRFVQAFEKMGQFQRQFYPIILHWIWKEKKKKKINDNEYAYYSGLLNYQLRYIDDFIRKPAEIYEYLTKKRTIPRSLDDMKDSLNGLYFLGRYSSWSPKLPRPRVFSINGGGKLLIWKGKGILIDPGFDLLNNLYAEGFSLEDVDAVIITHDHHDHTEDFEPMWRLIKEHNEVIKSSDEDEEENDKINLIYQSWIRAEVFPFSFLRP